jgi:hypothetical protein
MSTTSDKALPARAAAPAASRSYTTPAATATTATSDSSGSGAMLPSNESLISMVTAFRQRIGHLQQLTAIRGALRSQTIAAATTAATIAATGHGVPFVPRSSLHDIDEILTQVENDMIAIREHMARERALAVQAQQLVDAFTAQQQHIAMLQGNLPAHLPGARPTSVPVTGRVSVDNKSATTAGAPSNRYTILLFLVFGRLLRCVSLLNSVSSAHERPKSAAPGRVPSKTAAAPVTARARAIPTIPYITVDEIAGVPKYVNII